MAADGLNWRSSHDPCLAAAGSTSELHWSSSLHGEYLSSLLSFLYDIVNTELY